MTDMLETPADFTPLTEEEIARAFDHKPWLSAVRNRLLAGEPLIQSDRVHIWLARSRLADTAGRQGDALTAATRAETLARELDDLRLAGVAQTHRAIAELRVGSYDDAEKSARSALETIADDVDAAHAWLVLGSCRLEHDQWDEAEKFYLRAADVARRHQYDYALGSSLHNVGLVNLWRGRFELALHYAEEATDAQVRTGVPPISRPMIAALLFQIRNQRTEAWQALEKLREVTPHMPLFGALEAIFRANLHLDIEEFHAAGSEAARAYTLATRVGLPVATILARTVNSRHRRLTGNASAAVEWAQDAIAQARRFGYRYMEANALIEEGAAQRENGLFDAAEVCWQQAAEIAESIGARHEQAHALLLLTALRHARGSAEAATLWRQTTQIILEHGYAFLLERERSIAFPLVAAFARTRDPALRQTAEQLLARLAGVAALPLHIQVLGGMHIRRGGSTVDPAMLARRRSGQLLRFLLASPSCRAGRDQVVESFWPDQPPGKGQDMLHQATSTLRRALEPDLPDRFPSRYLEVDSENIRLLLPAGSTVDLHRLHMLMRQPEPTADEVDEAIALVRGDLFVEDRRADWAELPREEALELYHRALLLRAESSLQSGDAQAALLDCRTILKRDPLHEDAVLVAMRAWLLLENRSAALRLYHKLEDTLDSEFLLAPRDDLMRLAAQIRQRKSRT